MRDVDKTPYYPENKSNFALFTIATRYNKGLCFDRVLWVLCFYLQVVGEGA